LRPQAPPRSHRRRRTQSAAAQLAQTIAASRALKKNDTALFDSATWAWKAKVEKVPGAGNARRELLQKAIDEKTKKYKDANPGMDLENPRRP
jgi:hypothetical protein